MMPGLMPALTQQNLNLEYIDKNISTSTASSIDFGNFTVPRDGLVIVAVSGRSNNNGTVTDISIGGSSGTVHVGAPSGTARLAIGSRYVLSGSHNVTVTLSTSQGSTAPSLGVFVYVLTGYKSATPGDQNVSDIGADVTTRTCTLNVASQSCTVFVARIGSTSTVSSWSSATQTDVQTASGSSRQVAAVKLNSGAPIAGHSETLTWTTSSQGVLAGANWQ